MSDHKLFVIIQVVDVCVVCLCVDHVFILFFYCLETASRCDPFEQNRTTGCLVSYVFHLKKYNFVHNKNRKKALFITPLFGEKELHYNKLFSIKSFLFCTNFCFWCRINYAIINCFWSLLTYKTLFQISQQLTVRSRL